MFYRPTISTGTPPSAPLLVLIDITTPQLLLFQLRLRRNIAAPESLNIRRVSCRKLPNHDWLEYRISIPLVVEIN